MTMAYIGLVVIQLAVIARVVLRPHREPASRVAWVVVIAVVPVAGILAYLLLGTNIGRSRTLRAREVLASVPRPAPAAPAKEAHLRPEFRVKPKYAPWVDELMRFEGPIAHQNQHVFVGDWMTYVDEDIRNLLETPIRVSSAGCPA